MSIERELLSLERNFWTGDAEFYRQHLDKECLCVFTDMAGVMGKEQIASMIQEGQRWKNLDLEIKGFNQLSNDIALLTYEASASRATGEAYRAHVSSGYVKRNGSWKMAFHQQTPLQAKAR
jgi:hypothetical protein